MTRSEVRAKFKAIGYRASLRANPHTDKLLSLYVSGSTIETPMLINSASVFSSNFYTLHKPMFDVSNEVRGQMMTDTMQRLS